MARFDHQTSGHTVASLDQTLQVFRALLEAEGPVAIGYADEAIWAYLRPVPGLSAQADALATLRRETIALDHTSTFKTSLIDDLNRHQQRLSERSRSPVGDVASETRPG